MMNLETRLNINSLELDAIKNMALNEMFNAMDQGESITYTEIAVIVLNGTQFKEYSENAMTKDLLDSLIRKAF